MLDESTRSLLNAGMSGYGDRIRRARKDVGLTQEQLALAIGAAGQSTVGNYERSVNEPNLSTFRRIAEVTGRSERTLRRDWRRARAFLYDQLRHVGEAPAVAIPPPAAEPR